MKIQERLNSLEISRLIEEDHDISVAITVLDNTLDVINENGRLNFDGTICREGPEGVAFERIRAEKKALLERSKEIRKAIAKKVADSFVKEYEEEAGR